MPYTLDPSAVQWPMAAQQQAQAQGLPPGAVPQQQATTPQQQQQSQVTPELVRAMLAMQQEQSDQAKIDRQMKMANALRAQGMAPVQSTSPGGGRVGAPNWAQAIANVMAARKGTQMADEQSASQMNVDNARIGAMRQYFDALTNRKTPNATPSYMGEEGE
jgi:hypothetical protein